MKRLLLLLLPLNLVAAPSPIGPRISQTLATRADLETFKPSDNMAVRIMGYYAPGDMAPMDFVYDPEDSTTPTNGSTVIMPPSGRGRLKASKPSTGYWTPEHFGAKGTGNPADGDDGPAVRAAFEANGYALYPPLRSYYIDLSNSPITNGVRVGIPWRISTATASNRFNGPRIEGNGGLKSRLIFGGASGAGIAWSGITNFYDPHSWTITGSGRPDERTLWYYGGIKNIAIEQMSTDTNHIFNVVDMCVFSFELENVNINNFNTTWDWPAFTLNQCWNMTASGVYVEGGGRTKHGIQIFNANQQRWEKDNFFHGFANSTNSYAAKIDNAESLYFNFQDQARTEYGVLCLASGNRGNSGPWDFDSYHEGSGRPYVFRRDDPLPATITGSNIVATITGITGTTDSVGSNLWATATLSAPWGVYGDQMVTIAGVTSDTNYNGLVEVLQTTGSTFLYKLNSPWTNAVGSGASIVATQWLAVATTATPHRQSVPNPTIISGTSDTNYLGTFIVGYAPDPRTAVLLLTRPFVDPAPSGGFIQGDSYFGGVTVKASAFNGASGNHNSFTNIPRHFFEADYLRSAQLTIPLVQTRGTRAITVTNISTSTNGFVITATMTTKGDHQYNVGEYLSWRQVPAATYPGIVKIDSVPAANQVSVSYPSYQAVGTGTRNEIVQAASFGILLHTNTENVELDIKPGFDTVTSQHWYYNEAPEPWFTRDRTVHKFALGPQKLISKLNHATATANLENYTAAIQWKGSAQRDFPVPLYPKAIILRCKFTIDTVGADGRITAEFGRQGDHSDIRLFTQNITVGMAYAGAIFEETLVVPCLQSTGHFQFRLFGEADWQVDFEAWQTGAIY